MSRRMGMLLVVRLVLVLGFGVMGGESEAQGIAGWDDCYLAVGECAWASGRWSEAPGWKQREAEWRQRQAEIRLRRAELGQRQRAEWDRRAMRQAERRQPEPRGLKLKEVAPGLWTYQ